MVGNITSPSNTSLQTSSNLRLKHQAVVPDVNGVNLLVERQLCALSQRGKSQLWFGFLCKNCETFVLIFSSKDNQVKML